MTVVVVDDQLLGVVLRGERPDAVPGDAALFTTGYWYVRLGQAVLAAGERSGTLSGPFRHLPADLRERATAAVLTLPESIGLLSLRELGPAMGRLRRRHALNVLGLEALAAAVHLQARVLLSAPSPMLEEALAAESIAVAVAR